MPAQWSEDWQEYHRGGLELLMMSGRVRPGLFTDQLRGLGDQILGFLPPRGETPWRQFVAGRLLAGVGVEILLKGLYLKRGFSIRDPDNPQPLARLGDDSRRFNPRVSASFADLLFRHNLMLLDDQGRFFGLAALRTAQDWRNEAAHVPVVGVVDAGVHLARFGLALRFLHDELLEGADGAHVEAVAAVLGEPGRPPWVLSQG